MTTPVSEGEPGSLGVTPVAGGVNVAIFSAHATAIEICLFDESDRELERLRLPERTGDVFHGHFAGVRPGARYGLRAHGPFAPDAGHRFNAAKLLVDPHARWLDRPFRLHPAMFGYPERADDLAFDPTDSAPVMPKAIVATPSGPQPGPSSRIAWRDTILYELHVRGFTKLHPQVPEPVRGTFAGLAHPAPIEHLVKLGITSVEILPGAAWIEERHLAGLGLSNYWGYNPVALMAPEPRLAPGGWDEIRRTVLALEEAGIETIVDVVLNHSGEGDEFGPTLSLRGLDNASYYRLLPDDPRRYIDDSGCGNTLALDRPPVVRLAMDALRTWVREAGVHGFRFDLGTSLGRRPAGFDPDSPLLAAIQQDPELAPLKLIAEPWDVGPGGYQLGRFPAGWGEWNDRFRDDVRRFWSGEPHRIGAIATRLAGSADIFGAHRPASRGVNFVTAHDGFTLADLVAHERKRNDTNGEDNRDGTEANHSWNNGCEGNTADPKILSDRKRDQRALLACLLFARGTPMLAMGAELGHSQDGNNNCYAQDNELSWLSWERPDEVLLDITRRATALRREEPLLRADRRLDGAPGPDGISDVEWFNDTGQPMSAADWDAPDAGSLQMVLGGAGTRLAILVHRARQPKVFTLPPPRHGYHWTLLFDSSGETGDRAVRGETIDVGARSVLLVAEREQKGRSTGVSSATLRRVSEAVGIESEWWTVAGARHEVSDETRRHLLEAMRTPAGSEAEARETLARLAEERELSVLPPAVVARAGDVAQIPLSFEVGLRQPVWLSLRNEHGDITRILSEASHSRVQTALDGRRFERRSVPLPMLEPGHYELRRDDYPDLSCRLTIAPARAYLPQGMREGRKQFGVAAQLYALRREDDQGIGDFTTLAQLATLAAKAGASAVGINPLHALFAEQRERASPYHPSDRRYLNPLYLDLVELTGLPGGDALVSLLADGESGRLRNLPFVDYQAVGQLKTVGLRALFNGFEAWRKANPTGTPATELSDFTARGGPALQVFATFCALSAAHSGKPWSEWPTPLQDPTHSKVSQFAASHADKLRFHIFLQWLCDGQLSAAATAARTAGMEIGLYRDLAVGSAPDGAEAWAQQHLLASRVSIGAPPDPLGPAGQVWGLPPPIPHALTQDGYRSFEALLATNMAHAGALRIDHAMGVSRLFWVPQGAEGSDGAYVSYPMHDLIGHLALASHRARTMIIGEDLGTVPEGFRETLAEADILGYRVMLLERDGAAFRPPLEFPALSLACATNHDLPTLAGWWRGADIDERASLAHLSPEEARRARGERQLEKDQLAATVGADGTQTNPEELPKDFSAKVHGTLASGASLLVMAQVDDLGAEEQAINLPGTDTERANWRRKVRRPISEIFAQTGESSLQQMAAARP